MVQKIGENISKIYRVSVFNKISSLFCRKFQNNDKKNLKTAYVV